MAGRASVEFYVGLAVKGRIENQQRRLAVKGKDKEISAEVVEEAFVIRTFKNGVGVFVSK